MSDRIRLNLQPISFAEASAFIVTHHRHHIPSVSHKFSIGLNDGTKVVGVVVVGRPVSRNRDDGYTAEILRCCTDGTPNACSKLYAAAWRAARAMGYRRIGTYILSSESGVSLLASGYRFIYETKGGSWSCASRPRIDKHPTQRKLLYERP